jgi:hypothetical protein
MKDRAILEALAAIDRMEATAAHARSMTDDPEAQCIARMLDGAIVTQRERLRREHGRRLAASSFRTCVRTDTFCSARKRKTPEKSGA